MAGMPTSGQQVAVLSEMDTVVGRRVSMGKRLSIFSVLAAAALVTVGLVSCGLFEGPRIVFQPDGQGFVQFRTNQDSDLRSYVWASYDRTGQPNSPEPETITATVKKESGSVQGEFGVIFDYMSRDRFLWLMISTDGYYAFGSKVDSNWYTVLPWAQSSNIATGFSTENEIKIERTGDGWFSFYFNDFVTPVVTHQFMTAWGGGSAGFIAAIGDKSTEDFPLVPVDVRFKITEPYPVP